MRKELTTEELRQFRKTSNIVMIFQCQSKRSFATEYYVLLKNTSTDKIKKDVVNSLQDCHVPMFPITLEEVGHKSDIYEKSLNGVTYTYNKILDSFEMKSIYISVNARDVFMDDVIQNIC